MNSCKQFVAVCTFGCLTISGLAMAQEIQPGVSSNSTLSRAAALGTTSVAASTKRRATPTSTEGLGMNYTKIVIENLPVGSTISMQQIANLPMKVKNNYGTPIQANIQFTKPAKAVGEYQAVPDVNWIKAEASTVTIAANSIATTDIRISIPDEEQFFGKKYVAEVNIVTLGDLESKASRFGYRVTGYLMFGVAPGRNLEGLRQALNKPLDAAYSIFPPRIDLYDIVPGTKVKIMAPNHKPVELINESKKAWLYTLKSLDPAATDYLPDLNAHFSGVPEQVQLGKNKYYLKRGERAGLDIVVRVPENADLTTGPLIYLVAVTSGTRQGIVQYLKIYLWDKKPGVSKAAAVSNTVTAEQMK